MKRITRKNIDKMLDSGKLFVAMRNGNWWEARRNGATKTWKRDATRIRVPFKMGLYGYGAVETSDFDNESGALCSDHFRHKDNTPARA